MACHLKRDATFNSEFTGKAGNAVQISVEGEKGDARIVHARYAGKDLVKPWKFTIQKGLKLLILLVEDTLPGDWVRIIEVCGPSETKLLRRIKYDPANPARGYRILGT